MTSNLFYDIIHQEVIKMEYFSIGKYGFKVDITDNSQITEKGILVKDLIQTVNVLVAKPKLILQININKIIQKLVNNNDNNNKD